MSGASKVIVITGAAGSLGRAVAAAFAETGARRVLLDMNEAALKKAYPQADVEKDWLGEVDLMNASAVDALLLQIKTHWGRVDALCNIAGGFSMGKPVHGTTAADWQRMQDINVGTLLNMVRAAVPHLLASGGGKIVNIAAGAGQKGGGLMGAYSASKSSVIRITESMSAELREQNINVNCVLPSIIDTPPNREAMPDADPRRWVSPQDLAAVIRFLCSDQARAIHGAAIPVVGLS